VDDEPVLVHQPAAHELPGEIRSADAEVPVELASQVLEQLTHVAAHEAAVVFDLLEARGEHDLRHRIPDARELSHRIGRRGIVLARRPVIGHDLVQPAAVQRRIQRSHLVVEPGVQLVVDARPLEAVINGLGEPVE
jgi:hypothetical protein